MNSTRAPAIKVSGLHKTYRRGGRRRPTSAESPSFWERYVPFYARVDERGPRRTIALDGLEFEMPRGRLTGFLGPNGSGKTTTFRSVLGLTRPDAGDIEVLGMSAPADLPAITKKVGVIVEEPGLIKAHSGRINLEIAADTLGFGHERIDEMLDFVGLAGESDRGVNEYSKGMRQRLALAAALLGEPELLILDEPLDGLDPAGQKVFRARLRALTEEGTTVVVSSHDLADIEALADYVVMIDQGRLVIQGPIETLLGESSTRVVVEDKSEAVGRLRDAGIQAIADDGGVVVADDDGSRIVRILGEAGIFPNEVKPERISLESLFLDLTGEEVR